MERVDRGRGRPRGEPRGGGRAGRRRRGPSAGSPPASAACTTARSWSSRPTTGARRCERATAEFVRRGARAGLPPWPITTVEAISEDDDLLAMIRLGSLAGYPFEGPRVLGGWTPPARPAVYAIMYKPDPARETYAVIYVGHSDDLSAEALPVQPPARAVLDPARGQPLERVHLHLRGARRPAVAPRADRRRSWPRSTARAATSSSTTGRGRTSGSASTPRRPPARSPPAVTPATLTGRIGVHRDRVLRKEPEATQLSSSKHDLNRAQDPRARTAPRARAQGPRARTARKDRGRMRLRVGSRRRRAAASGAARRPGPPARAPPAASGVASRRRRSPRPCRTAAAARRRRPRRCG